MGAHLRAWFGWFEKDAPSLRSNNLVSEKSYATAPKPPSSAIRSPQFVDSKRSSGASEILTIPSRANHSGRRKEVVGVSMGQPRDNGRQEAELVNEFRLHLLARIAVLILSEKLSFP